MIINFSISNFGPILEKQTLSFEAEKSDHLENFYVINKNGFRLLKLALIYGPNASGKTTILRSLDFIKKLVTIPNINKTDELNFEPFLFNQNSPNQNSVITLEFLANNTRYYYEVEFNKKCVVKEVLFFHNPNKSKVYERVTDISNQLTQIEFGKKIKIDKTTKKILETNTLWNNTVLGGFLKTNAQINELKIALDWFLNYLKPMIYIETLLEGFFSHKINSGEISKSDVVNILKKADFNISDIIIKEEEKVISEDYLEFLRNQLKAPDEEVNKIQKKGRISVFKTEFEHIINHKKYTLPIYLESKGTRRYFELSGLLTLLIKYSHAVPLDELELSLHPDLYRHFLLSFLVNANHSQLIATTHNREILDNKDLFRNDVIWFTDKNEMGATELFSLADFDSHVIRNTSNILNAYKSGKLSAIPNLGDYYINLNS